MKVTFREDLVGVLLQKFRAEAPRLGIHISDLANPCLRRVYYAKKELAPTTDEDLLLWLAGKAHHSLLEGKLREIELEKDSIIGTIDCIDEERVITEFKTTRASLSKNVLEEYAFWREQLMGYCFLYGDTRARLFVLHLLGNWGKSKFLPALRAYELEFTEKELNENWKELLKRKDILAESLGNGIPPFGPRESMEWACEWCSARKICKEVAQCQL